MEHRRQLLLLAWKIPFELVLSSPSKFRAQNVQCHSARNTVSSVSVSCVLQDLCFALCVHALMLREAYGRSRCVCIILKVCTLWSSTVDMNFRACPSRVAVPCNGYSTPHSHSRGRSQFVCRLSLRHVFFEDLAVLQTVISRQHNRSHRAACQSCGLSSTGSFVEVTARVVLGDRQGRSHDTRELRQLDAHSYFILVYI